MKLLGWEEEAPGLGGRKLLDWKGELWSWEVLVFGGGSTRVRKVNSVGGRKKVLGLGGLALGFGDALGLERRSSRVGRRRL